MQVVVSVVSLERISPAIQRESPAINAIGKASNNRAKVS